MIDQAEYIEQAIQGAAECVLWQASDATEDGNGFPITDGGNEFSDQVIAEVPYITEATTAFVRDNWGTLVAAFEFNGYGGPNSYGGGQCGHDLILTANGHGVGFWDRGLGELGNRLTANAKPYSFEAEFALDADGEVDWLMVENIVLVDERNWSS